MDAAQGQHRETPTVVAVFENLADAEYGLDALQRTGLPRDDVSVVLRDADGTHQVLPEGDTGANIVSGAAAGATVGGVVGGLASGLLALLVPGIGPMLGTGVLTNVLAGLAVGAAGGGILGALLGLGVPEEDAATYQEHVQAGRVLMTITAGSPAQAQQVLDALEASNAYDVRMYPGPPARTGSAPAGQPPVSLAEPVPRAPGPAARDRAVAGPPPPTQPAPPAVGDVAAVAEGGPDVRGESGAPALADRGLTDADSDLSAWRSGGEDSRPAPPAERGLGTERGVAPQSEAAAAGGGDVAAAKEGGPDVRPPGADQAPRDLEGAEAPGVAWADDPTDWRSGGEGARAETGEGVDAVAPSDRGLAQPAPAPGTTPPDDTYYTNPRLLSRSALRYAVSGDSGASRGLAPDAATPNPEGYGDADT